MTGIGATLEALKRARVASEGLSSLGVMTETQSFGSNPGALRMLSFRPPNLAKGAPLVVVLHGCTQTAEAHAVAAGWADLARRSGFALLAPEQRPSNNPNNCFNWFEPSDTARDRGEAASIIAMVKHMLDEHELDEDRVFITGLSAGGAMTSAMLAAYPEVFAGGAIIAGLPYGAADSVQTAFQAMRGVRRIDVKWRGAQHPKDARLPRVTVWHGDADHTVNAANVHQIARQWLNAHGLPFDEGATETSGRRTRTTWRAPNTQEILVETNIVRGLGHGTPLSTRGENGVGAEAPYMLEAEISAVIEIAQFWGLPLEDAHERLQVRENREPSAKTQRSGLGDSIMASLAGRIPADAQSVISNALRQAGLMH